MGTTADVRTGSANRRRATRKSGRLPVVLALLLTGVGAFCAGWLVVTPPHRFIWLMAFVAREYALFLIAVALGGLGAAAVGWRQGARRAPLVAAALATTTVVVAAGPPFEAREDALRIGVELSLAEYFTGGLAFLAPGEPHTEVYAAPEGQQLHADVYLPEGVEEPVPAVVLVHGGAWRWGERSMTPRWNSWLNAHGYAVFDIAYRLEPPPTWRRATGDVLCAVGWARRHADRFGVDPDRLALMGSSAGGHLALLAAYAADEDALPPSCEVDRTDVQAVVALYPPTDLVHSYELADEPTPVDGRALLERFTGGTPDSAPRAYRMASPITHVAPDSPPTFLAQGAHDRMQSPADTVMLADGLAEEGVEHELLWLEHAGHAFHGNWSGFASQMTRPLLHDFLHRHVGAPE